MRYFLMNLPFLVAGLGAAYYFDRQVFRRRSSWLLLGVLVIMTTIFNTYLTRLPIVRYNQDALLGLKVGTIPIEDYAYTLVLAFLPASAWRRINVKEKTDEKNT